MATISTKKASKTAKKILKLKHGKQILITGIVIVLIIAIVLGGLYIFAPDMFTKIFGAIGGKLPSTDIAGDVLSVNFFDIEQGDFIVIQFPDKKNMIIDAGHESRSSEDNFKTMVKPKIDKLGITTFHYLMLTHTDKDHVGFMDEVLEYYEVLNIYRPAFRAKSEPVNDFTLVDTNIYNDFIEAVNNEMKDGAQVHMNIGKNNIKGEGYNLDIYGVEESAYKVKTVDAHKANAVSTICILEYSGKKVALTGDAEGSVKINGKTEGNGAESVFMKNNTPIDIDVLKIGHHGSSSSASEEFLAFLDPEFAVISVGKNNKYGHPRNECLDRLKNYRDVVPDDDYGAINNVYRTDINGDILLKIGSNGGMQFSVSA